MAKPRELGKLNASIDEKDWILIEQVQSDARMAFAELGRRAGLSPPAAAERLRRLEDSGLITGYHAGISAEKMGLSLAALIEVQVKRDDYQKFHNAVENLPWVLESYHVSGRASFVLRVAVPNVEGLELLIGHLSQYGDTFTSLILSTKIARREFRFESKA